jgi:hypothetical protein
LDLDVSEKHASLKHLSDIAELKMFIGHAVMQLTKKRYFAKRGIDTWLLFSPYKETLEKSDSC